MNFQSLIDSPKYGSDRNSEYSGSPYNNTSYLSPPPSGCSDDDFQEESRFVSPHLPQRFKNQPSTSTFIFQTAGNMPWFSNHLTNIQKQTGSSSILQPPTLKPTFPNLFRSLNDSKGESNKKLHPSPKKGQIIACHTCQNQVKSTELERHLFFGPAKCVDCERLVRLCSEYSLCKALQYGKDHMCPHNVWEWQEKPVDYLRQAFGNDINFKKLLTRYIHSLHPLRTIRPYKKAIESCNEYLRFSCVTERKIIENPPEMVMSFGTKSNKTKTIKSYRPILPKPANPTLPKPANPTLPKPDKPSISKPDKPKEPKAERGKKRKSELSDYLELPTNGHYLIMRKTIEECPDCYTQLEPKDLVFNLDTWLISINCKYCYLSIYFVLDPPDKSDPKIKIITD